MHQEHSSMLSEELSLLTIDLFLKGKKPKQTPSLPKRAVTSAAEVTACFRNHPTSHQSCAGVKRELERSRHLPVILSKEAAAPGGSTSTELLTYSTDLPTLFQKIFVVSWLVKPESWTKGWVQPHKQLWSAPQYCSLSNLHHVTSRLTEKANSAR